MEQERFEQFTVLISGIYRNIQKLKSNNMGELGLKNVHIFWVYLLYTHQGGLTASELAQKSTASPALVSREIDALIEKGYVATDANSRRRRYGWKFRLTKNGEQIAARIRQIAFCVQETVDEGITKEDLATFYRVFNTLSQNFDALADSCSKNAPSLAGQLEGA